ncbi:hypothetical protein [Synoicihabitans lomoniglobus]|nr:hypothetical protein [Opitutaceae bacterium LMO-M01]
MSFLRFARFAAGLVSGATLLTAYDNFEVAVYTRAYEVRQMADPAWLESHWGAISSELHIDKVYLETHRDLIIVDAATLEAAKAFFAARGIETAGGITFTIDEPNRFETFSYSNPEHRAKVQEIVEHTARHFDEIILDDFFFTSTKSTHDIAAKGDRTWTDYRLDVMAEAGQHLVVDAARAINPRARVIIKYPNWYDHFSALGFDLQRGPQIFDGVHSGTETRNAVTSAQHLQPYLSYNIIRYFENLAPGRNGGGWVDIFASSTTDRYAEQLELTLLAKAREIALFQFDIIANPITPAMRGAWQDQSTSFDYDALPAGANFATVAGQTFAAVDRVLGALGEPIGLQSYKPFHSTQEAFLQNFLGMAGLPMDIVPTFPTAEPIVLLTAQAAQDPAIVEKITTHLTAGKTVVITSGLLRELQDRGLQHIAELEHSGRVALVHDYTAGRRLVHGEKPILIPQITYRTNDSWELVSGIDGPNGWPLLHDADYLDGQLQILTIPENFADFSAIAPEALDLIRAQLTAHLPVRLEGPGKISLFVYDNGTFVVQSFRDEPADVAVVVDLVHAQIEDIVSGEHLSGEVRMAFRRWDQPPTPDKHAMAFSIAPHSYRAFRLK